LSRERDGTPGHAGGSSPSPEPAERSRQMAADSESSEEEEVFDASKFRLAKANLGPASGSNLRAWAVAAAAADDGSSGEESADDELDWIQSRQMLRGTQRGAASSSMPAVALPTMRSDEEDSGSGSDVEPIFIRR